MLPIKTIVCPSDFSAPSLQALDAACALAAHFGAALCLLHIVPFSPPLPSDLAVIAGGIESDQARINEALAHLQKIAASRVPPTLPARCEVRMGEAAHEIANVADELESSLIVISTHGLTGWRHLAFGSVAETIVRLSRRPVLTLHAQPEKSVTGDEIHVENPNHPSK